MAQPKANPHKLIWLQVMAATDKKAYSLCTAEDLSSFGYFQRSSVREHLVFASRTSAERCPKGSRVTISLKEVPYILHVYRRVDGLCGIAITDQAYSERVAQTLVTKLTAGFEKQFGNNWKKVAQDEVFNYPQINQLLQEYVNPNQADKMMAVQQNLDEIKQIMHKNIEDILERGETLDNLLQKSDDIGEVSKMFHSKAKKNNQCCQLY
eukprot:CAMPEP_0197072902 /NCGR_PEP_ID=MMETSP1384-20130603/210331_1 /TAXON_ID=29189 /ORGANISM="Ammonia sp." /LENGTH=208 /DNA_ID=CAMNT_0042511723 /DNA_START=93 /DNA_END=719 /DNA_ORIENTATION=+